MLAKKQIAMKNVFLAQEIRKKSTDGADLDFFARYKVKRNAEKEAAEKKAATMSKLKSGGMGSLL